MILFEINRIKNEPLATVYFNKICFKKSLLKKKPHQNWQGFLLI
jgi:hypothetical protein